MTAAELIKELQQVHPATEVRIVTDNGSKPIIAVHRMGYTDMCCSIEPAED